MYKENGIALWYTPAMSSVHKNVYTRVSVSYNLHTVVSARARPCGTCANTSSSSSENKPVVVSCVSITNKTITLKKKLKREQRVTLLSDVPLCCCCLSLQVVSYHACVCGLFHSYVFIHCVSVLSMPSECCVCVVVCGFNFVFFPSLLCLFVSLPTPTDLHLGEQKHSLQFRKVWPWKQTLFTDLYLYMYMYLCTGYILFRWCT